VWASVKAKEGQLEEDEQMLEASKNLLQRHKDEAADDAAPLR
jgi:hypothetical protein